jgi:hypothetical protein
LAEMRANSLLLVMSPGGPQTPPQNPQTALNKQKMHFHIFPNHTVVFQNFIVWEYI